MFIQKGLLTSEPVSTGYPDSTTPVLRVVTRGHRESTREGEVGISTRRGFLSAAAAFITASMLPGTGAGRVLAQTAPLLATSPPATLTTTSRPDLAGLARCCWKLCSMFGSPEAKARMYARYAWMVLPGRADEGPRGKCGSYTDEQQRYTPFNMQTNEAGPTFRSWTEAQRWMDIARMGTEQPGWVKDILQRLQS